MQIKLSRSPKYLILFVLTIILLFATSIHPAYSHWADLSVAEITVSDAEAEVTLTYPTGLTNFADDNRDSQLQPIEIRNHQPQLEQFFSQQIRIANSSGISGAATVKSLEIATKTASLIQQPNTHTTLILNYSFPAVDRPIIPGLKDQFRITYNLFLPGVPTASCQAAILFEGFANARSGSVKSFIFTPQNREFVLGTSASIWDASRSLLLAIAGAFTWGAAHAMSPGHGKTLVGAYLVGARATGLHALFLAATTTITHTAGVFAIGGITLFASGSIEPEKLNPWLSLISGLLIGAIGLQLLLSGSKIRFAVRTSALQKLNNLVMNAKCAIASLLKKESNEVFTTNFEEPVNLLNRGTWEREYKPVKPKINHHYHHHGDGRYHSHLPPGADGSPVTWKSLLALGISGGLLPCPSALVMLLSASALGNVGLGMTLVVAFSLGLALVLSAIGLILVYARRKFDRLPKHLTATKFLPAISAMLIMFLGLGITGQAVLQILAANS
ncbi:MAG: high-affinity nickel-transporter [Richelia sp. CSU_2_1]|nr:high-affinity nickel-transporter [Microcoleus sp. SU_5_6]NJL69500.1 high-affinity nickel-transporter [Microcoleus sp. SM1_3_4]NJR23824.1 high-affinity nickel-transporter [Richelia sp. CSU_2_1]